MQDVVRGLRQALVMLVFSVVVAVAGAGLWFALQGGELRSKVAIALMVIAGLISLTSGTAFPGPRTSMHKSSSAWVWTMRSPTPVRV